jgi:hypothetical protein
MIAIKEEGILVLMIVIESRDDYTHPVTPRKTPSQETEDFKHGTRNNYRSGTNQQNSQESFQHFPGNTSFKTPPVPSHQEPNPPSPDDPYCIYVSQIYFHQFQQSSPDHTPTLQFIFQIYQTCFPTKIKPIYDCIRR